MNPTPVSAAAATARETARDGSGKFGTQDHAESGLVDVADPNPNLTAIRAALASNPEHVLDVVAGMIANLGAHPDWDNDVTEGTTGDLADLALASGLLGIGDQTRAALKFYRAAAQEEQDVECACQGGRLCDHEGPCEADPNEDDWGYDDMCRSCCDNAEDAENDADEAGTGVCSECGVIMSAEAHSTSCSAHPDAETTLCSCHGGDQCDHSGECGDYPATGGKGMCASCAAITGYGHCDECSQFVPDSGHLPNCTRADNYDRDETPTGATCPGCGAGPLTPHAVACPGSGPHLTTPNGI